jgi:Protein of unknown function (DUF3800)
MLVFIDEAGRFIPGDRLSVVCALTIPHRSAGPCRRELLRITKGWARRNGELKAGELNVKHLDNLIDVLYRHDALLHAIATDPRRQSPEVIARHQATQAEGMTKHLSDDHLPSLVEDVWALRRILERMPAQLYLQCVAMHQLIWEVVTEAVNFFSQRRPRELSKFEWFVDAKDPTRITSQEKWWHEVIGPLGESRSLREPLWIVRDKGYDSSHFDRAFSIEKQARDPVRGIDIKKLIVDHLSFVDSKTELLIQAVDVLTGFMRRALGSRTVERGLLRALGRLMIRRKRNGVLQTVQLVTLGPSHTVPNYLTARLQAIALSGRAIIKPKRSIARRSSTAKNEAMMPSPNPLPIARPWHWVR